jgi:hypothetical protein
MQKLGENEKAAAVLRQVKERLEKKKEPPTRPTDVVSTTMLCSYFYNYTRLPEVKSAVDMFIAEILTELSHRGIKAETEIDRIVREMVHFGYSLLTKTAQTANGPRNVFNHFLAKAYADDTHGTPFLTTFIEELSLLKNTLECIDSLDEDDASRNILTLQADHLKKLLLRRLQKPLGGKFLEIRNKKIGHYANTVQRGWSRMMSICSAEQKSTVKVDGETGS